MAARHSLTLLLRLLVVAAVASMPVGKTLAQDWPTYRADAGRTGASAEPLPSDLAPLWTRSLTPPSPAWPAPARGSYWQNLSHIEPRVVDDQADHPVIAGDAVYLGSSADDHVRCLDLDSGVLRWSFATGGPVRFAPVVSKDLVLVGSDDGLVYALDAATGQPQWSRRIGPEGDLIVGNGRLVSPWPVRTGIVVRGDRLYVCAGLFPSQGVYAACLDVATGESLWTRRLDLSPQGYLLVAGDLLIVPTGRGTPVSLRLADGADGPPIAGVGGTYAVVEGERVVSGRGNDNTLASASAATGQSIVQFPGKHIAASPSRSYLLGRGKLAAVDRTRGEADPAGSLLWAIDCEPDEALALAGGQVLVGGRDAVHRFDAQTGERFGSLEVGGRALGIAAAHGRLIVTTDRGELRCFGPAGRPATVHAPVGDATTALNGASPEIAPLLARLDSPLGYALVCAEQGGVETAAEIARRSRLHVVLATRAAPDARRALLQAGLYGRRVSVVTVEGGALPFADYIFNLVVASGSVPFEPAELERVVAPGRGLVSADGEVRRRPPLRGVGSWTSQFANLANTANSGDAFTTGSLALQWFGGPGPDRMIDRHMRGPPPLAAGGRLFILGENRVIGLDSYNGTELWDTPLPDSQRYAMPYDAAYISARTDALFAAVDNELWKIDAATGEVVRRTALPAALGEGLHVGYVGVEGDELFLSATLPGAHRVEPGRTLADTSYRSNRPLVTARAFGAFDEPSGRAVWTRASGVIIHPTITVTPRSVCFVESRNAASIADATGRIALDTLLASDAWLVCLDRATGQPEWELPLDLTQARNILYLQHDRGRLILTACEDAENNDAYYHVRVLDAADGAEIWRSEHGNRKPGELYHGEQVHHPVVLGDLLVAEPYIYDLATGERVNPDGGAGEWTINRPGHSCGTMSGSGDCLFFRAGNPTVLDLRSGVPARERFTALSPSRVGCWINILPVDGMVLIPESSASCVCHYSLQTSMGFRPLP